MGNTIKVVTIKEHAPLDLDHQVNAVLKEHQNNNCHVQFMPLMNPSGRMVYTAMVEIREA